MDLGHLLDLYQRNKLNAEKRGIDYGLSFKQWLEVWGEQILTRRRGHGSSRLRLERIDKRRGYYDGNVHITARKMPK
jgi:hypothetical protein